MDLKPENGPTPEELTRWWAWQSERLLVKLRAGEAQASG